MSHQGYGAFPGGDPRKFWPDAECSTEEEREAHRRACIIYEAHGALPPLDPDHLMVSDPEGTPTGEPCPHLRVGTREGKPWTCRDCGAVRVNGEWSAAPADARLIAAAPELLDALRFIHEHAFEAKWSGDERGLGLVEAAIAKAEGRAP